MIEKYELEGTWEEIRAHDAELAGKRVKLTVLEPERPGSPKERAAFRPAKGSLQEYLRQSHGWAGDDFEECLQLVYATRSKAEF